MSRWRVDVCLKGEPSPGAGETRPPLQLRGWGLPPSSTITSTGFDHIQTFRFRSLRSQQVHFPNTPIDMSRNSCYTGAGPSAEIHYPHVRRRPRTPSRSSAPTCCTAPSEKLEPAHLRCMRLAERRPDHRRHLNKTITITQEVISPSAAACLLYTSDAADE